MGRVWDRRRGDDRRRACRVLVCVPLSPACARRADADTRPSNSTVKTFCLARGKQQEEKKLKWALRAQVVREGGFVLPTMMRLTFLPGHCACLPRYLTDTAR